MNTLRLVDRGINKFNAGLSFAGAIWVLALMLLIVADVLGRILFSHPIVGVPDIAKNSVVGIACFMLPWTMAIDSHIRSEVIIEHAPRPVVRVLNVFAYLIGLSVFVGIVYSGWEPLVRAIETGAFEGEGSLKIVSWPVRTLILIASALSAYHCLIRMLANISRRFDFSAAAKDEAAPAPAAEEVTK